MTHTNTKHMKQPTVLVDFMYVNVFKVMNVLYLSLVYCFRIARACCARMRSTRRPGKLKSGQRMNGTAMTPTTNYRHLCVYTYTSANMAILFELIVRRAK